MHLHRRWFTRKTERELIDGIYLEYNVLEKGPELKADGREEWQATKVKVEKCNDSRTV